MSKEPPKQAAKRLASAALRDGYVPEALHEYRDAQGVPVFWRIRCKHPDGRKWIRPMRPHDDGYAIGEPPAPDAGKPLYRLPELLADTARAVWIVEGEWAADVLCRRGVLVTTSGAADSAAAADWAPLAGRPVVIWPDFDMPGAKYANAVAERLLALGCEVRMVQAAALGLEEKGDAVDWLALHPDGDMDALPMAQVTPEPERAAPEPLRRPVAAPEPYPLAELGPTLASAAESLQRVIRAPEAICGASVLAAASLAVQALANVEVDGRTMPLSLWLLTVAASGERKSAVDTEVMQAAREFERSLAKQHDADAHRHAAQLAEWEARCAYAKSKAKGKGGAGLADALQAIGPTPDAPLLPRVTVSDFTAEGLAKLLAIGWPSVGAFTDEAALVFGGHGMNREAVARTAATLCKLWDSGTLDRVRALDGATKLHGRRLAMHLMAQPVIAEAALSDDVLRGQGFLARFLMAWPESTVGNRPYQAESLRDDVALNRLAYRLGELHRAPLPLADGERQELSPRTLHLDAAAKAVWVQLHDVCDKEAKAGGRFHTVQAWASKTPAQAQRIAGVLALLESDTVQRIDEDTMRRAAELALWHLNEALRLAGTAAASQEVRQAEQLLAWCHDAGRALLYSADALRNGPSCIRDAQAFTRAARLLDEAGWAEYVEGGMSLDGSKRRNVWRVRPAAEAR